MNESFFGKYSVFCVFGSVVGCVVVPLIAQVLQQQSMECMILSAIVITLTAAHLKKSGTDSSKIIYKEYYEKRRYNNNTKKKSASTNTNPNHHANNNSNCNVVSPSNTYQQQQQQQYYEQEQQYLQQHEHLKIIELENRNEEKRLRKLKKREERLKRKEEENQKQKVLEEKCKALKEKRRKRQNENLTRVENTSHNTAFNNYEKYVHFNEESCRVPRRRKALDAVHENLSKTATTSTVNHQGSCVRQRIPRFTNSRSKCTTRDQNTKFPVTETLSINCLNLSASCSSLSSISSSGSSSPPPPLSPPPVSSAWTSSSTTTSPNKNSDYRIHKEQSVAWLLRSDSNEKDSVNQQQQKPQADRVLKSYSNFRPVRNKVPTYSFDSSSLFCSGQDEMGTRKLDAGNGNGTIDSNGLSVEPSQFSNPSREYSLFGSHQFGNSFLKSPII